MLYKYDLNSKKTTLLSKENNPYYDILPIDGNVFFVDAGGYSTMEKSQIYLWLRAMEVERRNYTQM